MPGGPVRFTLHDGERLTVDERDVQLLYEVLWSLAPKPGAVTIAALMNEASRESGYTRAAIDLSEAQSALLLEALGMLCSGPDG